MKKRIKKKVMKQMIRKYGDFIDPEWITRKWRRSDMVAAYRNALQAEADYAMQRHYGF